MNPTILLLCPHNAAKSATATAYFGRLAAQHGLNFYITSAGSEPDNEVAPAVVEQLVDELKQSEAKPHG